MLGECTLLVLVLLQRALQPLRFRPCTVHVSSLLQHTFHDGSNASFWKWRKEKNCQSKNRKNEILNIIFSFSFTLGIVDAFLFKFQFVCFVVDVHVQLGQTAVSGVASAEAFGAVSRDDLLVAVHHADVREVRSLAQQRQVSAVVFALWGEDGVVVV